MAESERRDAMVSEQLERRDITDVRVLAAMRRVPRHEFAPAHVRARAYDDGALPIGSGQTLSQPYMVALMTQLAVAPDARRALDVGGGSGYQAAVLAELVEEVDSVERLPELAGQARERLARLGYGRGRVHCADGYDGWPAGAPYDAIIVACAAPSVPGALVAQLAPGGRLVLPLGEASPQTLTVVEKDARGRVERRSRGGVLFVPMLPGRADPA
jgi:protein-L-isoaspartate(D-aspartate) O-methyltransferase